VVNQQTRSEKTTFNRELSPSKKIMIAGCFCYGHRPALHADRGGRERKKRELRNAKSCLQALALTGAFRTWNFRFLSGLSRLLLNRREWFFGSVVWRGKHRWFCVEWKFRVLRWLRVQKELRDDVFWSFEFCKKKSRSKFIERTPLCIMKIFKSYNRILIRLFLEH
jgi:hypothetical protein